LQIPFGTSKGLVSRESGLILETVEIDFEIPLNPVLSLLSMPVSYLVRRALQV
jgi:hypothetical protein